MRLLLVVGAGLMLTGCTALLGPVGLAVDAITGGVGIYQRWEDRNAQKNQTAEIKLLREEIQKLREVLVNEFTPTADPVPIP